jgi:hypothetical protein
MKGDGMVLATEDIILLTLDGDVVTVDEVYSTDCPQMSIV